MCIRRDLFEQPAGFVYYEDVELCYRVGAAGSRICYFPGASIIRYRNKAPIRQLHRKHRMRQFARKHYVGMGWATRWTAELLCEKT